MTESKDTENSQKTLLFQRGFLTLPGILEVDQREQVTHWCKSKPETGEYRTPRGKRKRFGGSQAYDYYVSAGRISHQSPPDKMRDSISVELRMVGHHRPSDDEEPYIEPPCLSEVRLLRLPVSKEVSEPVMGDFQGIVIVYGCLEGSIEFQINRGTDVTDVLILPGDVLLVLNTNHHSVESIPAVRHGWKEIAEETFLIQCSD